MTALTPPNRLAPHEPREQSDYFLWGARERFFDSVLTQHLGRYSLRSMADIRQANFDFSNAGSSIVWISQASTSIGDYVHAVNSRVTACKKSLEGLEEAVALLAWELNLTANDLEDFKGIGLEGGLTALRHEMPKILERYGVADVRLITLHGIKSRARLLGEAVATLIEGEDLLIKCENFQSDSLPLLDEIIPSGCKEVMRKIAAAGHRDNKESLALSADEEGSLLRYYTTELPENIRSALSQLSVEMNDSAAIYSNSLIRLLKLS